MKRLRKYFRMWVYGGIMIIAVEMGRDARLYSKNNFNHYLDVLVSASLIFLGPFIMYFLAKDFVNIDLDNQDISEISNGKAMLIAGVIAIGCIALIAVAFMSK